MVELSLRGSRMGLAFVVLLIGVLAVANCNTYVYNNSPYDIQIDDVTTPVSYAPLSPNTAFQLPWDKLPDGTSPAFRLFFLAYFVAPGNNSATGLGEKIVFAMTPVYVNASITLFQPTNKDTTAGRIGFTLSYR